MPRLDHDAKMRLARARDEMRDPFLTALTGLLIVLIFVIIPLHAAGTISVHGYGFFLVILLAACILVQSRQLTLVIVISIGVSLVVASIVGRVRVESNFDLYLEASGWLLIELALIWVVAGAVFAPGRVTYHRINGAVLLYLTIGLAFAGFFTFVGLLAPQGFSGLTIAKDPALSSNLIYFSFVTLTSIGYGDIVPVHPMARALCNVEGIIGQLYPATLLARLVTLEIQGRANLR
ncbi:MAG: potassium channel family protein [Methylocella sp.]